MKKNFFRAAFLPFALLAAALLFGAALSSCMSATTVSHGLENVAYLEIMGDTAKYKSYGDVQPDGSRKILHVVSVVIDGGPAFDADVNSIKQRAVKNKYAYKIATGAHEIEISFEGTVVSRSKIFTSANQTKIIELP